MYLVALLIVDFNWAYTCLSCVILRYYSCNYYFLVFWVVYFLILCSSLCFSSSYDVILFLVGVESDDVIGVLGCWFFMVFIFCWCIFQTMRYNESQFLFCILFAHLVCLLCFDFYFCRYWKVALLPPGNLLISWYMAVFYMAGIEKLVCLLNLPISYMSVFCMPYECVKTWLLQAHLVRS